MVRTLRSLRRYLLDRIVLRPTRSHIPHGSQRRVTLSIDDRALECFVQRNHEQGESSELLVIKFPGTGGRAERSSLSPVSMLRNVRGEVWTWNPPGYGGSQGRASLRSIATAAQRLTEQILSHDGVSPRAIWLCGNSLGCNVALHVASKIDHRGASVGLVLRNPPALIPVIMRIADRYPMGRFVRVIAEELCDEMNAMKTAPLVSFPAVFMQSGEDEVVPPSIQNELIQVYGGDRRVVHLAGLGHAGLANPEQEVVIQSEIRWLWERTQRGQSTCTTH